MPQLTEMASGSKIDRSQLPKNATKQTWDQLFQYLETKVKDNEAASLTLKKLNLTWEEISEAEPFLSQLLSLQGEIVSDAEARWRAILSSILEKNQDLRDDFYFTEQEEALVTVLAGIGHCGPKKNEGILTAYLLIDPKYHYSIKPPEWRAAEETEALEKKEAALHFIQKFVQTQGDKTLEEMVNPLKELINNLENLHKYSKTILPQKCLKEFINCST